MTELDDTDEKASALLVGDLSVFSERVRMRKEIAQALRDYAAQAAEREREEIINHLLMYAQRRRLAGENDKARVLEQRVAAISNRT